MREKWQICYVSLRYCRLGCEIIQTRRSMSNLKPDRRAGSMFQHTDTDAGLVVVALVKDTSSLHSDQTLHPSNAIVIVTSKTTLNFLTRFSSWETVFQVKFINITRSRQCNERCWKCTCVCSAKEYRALFHWSERNCDKYRESITVSLYSFMRHYESSDTSETVTCTLPYLHLKCCWQGLSRPLT